MITDEEVDRQIEDLTYKNNTKTNTEKERLELYRLQNVKNSRKYRNQKKLRVLFGVTRGNPLTEAQKLQKEVSRLQEVLAMAETRESYLIQRESQSLRRERLTFKRVRMQQAVIKDLRR